MDLQQGLTIGHLHEEIYVQQRLTIWQLHEEVDVQVVVFKAQGRHWDMEKRRRGGMSRDEETNRSSLVFWNGLMQTSLTRSTDRSRSVDQLEPGLELFP